MGYLIHDHLLGKINSINPDSAEIIIIRLCFTILFTITIYAFYNFSSKNKRKVSNHYIILIGGPIICIILMAIGSSIPRAFGLFAALSIVRFRAPIKDTKVMTFIFLSIAIGICCGAGAIKVALIGIIFIGIFVVAIKYWENRTKGQVYYSLNISLKVNDDQIIKEIEEVLKGKVHTEKKVESKYYAYFSFLYSPKTLEYLKDILIKHVEIIDNYEIGPEYSIEDL